MSEDEPRVRRLAALVPVVAAAAVYGSAQWCYTGASAPSGTVALVGGAVLVVGAPVVYFACVSGSGSVFGALFLALGLLLTATATDQAAARGEVAPCVVRDVETRVQSPAGEGAPGPKTAYRHLLDCPGGYPDELRGDRRIADKGAEIRVAYDARHRVSPAVEGENSPWPAGSCAVALLALSTLLAAAGRGPDT
ncbi:hypothetical protein [Streptomyces sp. NBC_01205]|uniref:hypothetical protein n=1 Tax=Streptomyces sp. NBC_01205 TaxID=2903771 RepID=UPI002E11552A|nr:hypothetical protein OG573_30595 [Streptomyces sp. NBC_01205]